MSRYRIIKGQCEDDGYTIYLALAQRRYRNLINADYYDDSISVNDWHYSLKQAIRAKQRLIQLDKEKRK